MADQPSIFGSTEQPPTQATPNANPAGGNPVGAPPANDVTTLLSSIKNERGEQKYQTLEAALEGLRNAQEFIPSLRQQTAERTLNALTSQQPPTQQTAAPVVDANVVADLVNRTLTQREQQAVAQANLNTVVTTLQSVFGTDAESKFYGRAGEFGMTREEMNALAAKSPQAVLTMLGVNQQPQQKGNQVNPTSSTVNTAAYTPNPQSFIGRNPKGVIVGATYQDIKESSQRAKDMVKELHDKGMSVHDLTDPKVYAKFFK
jgi:hypothetical protein